MRRQARAMRGSPSAPAPMRPSWPAWPGCSSPRALPMRNSFIGTVSATTARRCPRAHPPRRATAPTCWGRARTEWRKRRSGPRASPGAPRRASPLSRASWPAQGGRSSCRDGARSARPSASNRPERSACFPCLRATSVFPARTAAPASGFSGLSFPMIQWGRTRLMWPSPRFSGRARSSGGALLRLPTACVAPRVCPRR